MKPSAPLVVDWVTLMAELRRMGMPARTIASHVSLSHSVLIDYAQGVKSPIHANGERLIAFWMQATGKAREQLPTTAPILSASSR